MAIANERTVGGDKVHDHVCDTCEEIITEGCAGTDCDSTVVELCDPCESDQDADEELEDDEESEEQSRT